jgi:hypothetical protein
MNGGMVMDRDSLTRAQQIRDAANPRPIPMEPTILDDAGRPLRPAQSWAKHPQMRQKASRRLEPWQDENEGLGYQYDDPARVMHRHDARGDVNVSVNNDGRYYRTVREELQVKGGSMIMDLLAWPFRLVKGFIETIVNGLASLFGFVLKMLILPAVLLMGYGIYQSGRERPASETAKIVGKEGVGVIGGLFKGIWNGIVGDDEPEAAKTKKDADADDAETSSGTTKRKASKEESSK